MTDSPTRRGFLAAAASAAAGAGALAWADALEAADPGPPGRALASGTVVLFQGDSITDCDRNRSAAGANVLAALGNGYPLLLSSALLDEHPDRALAFYNRGVSGNRVPDLVSRWQADTIAIQPQVLSVLIGVNDLWHKLMGRSNGTVADYESGYASLLADTRRTLPDVRLVVLEPFVLRTGHVTDAWFPEFDQRRAAARRVAERSGATFIPLQGLFDRAVQRAPAPYWLADGVHPTPAGHWLIARAWRAAIIA